MREAEPTWPVVHGHDDHAVAGLAQERRNEPMKAVEELEAVDAAPVHRAKRARAVADLVAEHGGAHAVGDS